ncbi:MAG: urate hydroxylase PuuD [Myxococcaceae bacterium]
MNPEVNNWLTLFFRWIHVVAGIAWIGHLYFFNFVNAQVVKTYDADSKKKVVPELMPRALYWFRFGALYTWVTGILLLGLVYYMGGVMNSDSSKTGLASAVGLGLVLFGFFIYDALWKALGKNETVAAGISFVLVVGLAFGLRQLMEPRAVFIHLGSIFGSIMMMNVWMRIWPSQRKIIGGIKGTNPAPDAAVPALAGLRSKHNTYMSVPLVFFMVSNHYPTIFAMDANGMDLSWILASLFVAVGWGVTKLLYNKSAAAAPAQF